MDKKTLEELTGDKGIVVIDNFDELKEFIKDMLLPHYRSALVEELDQNKLIDMCINNGICCCAYYKFDVDIYSSMPLCITNRKGQYIKTPISILFDNVSKEKKFSLMRKSLEERVEFMEDFLNGKLYFEKVRNNKIQIVRYVEKKKK